MRVITNLRPCAGRHFTSRRCVSWLDDLHRPRGHACARLNLPVGRARRASHWFLDLSGGTSTSGLETTGLADAVPRTDQLRAFRATVDTIVR